MIASRVPGSRFRVPGSALSEPGTRTQNPAPRTKNLILLLLTFLLAAACSAPPATSPHKQEVVWETVGSWSDRGNRQLESFQSDSGMLRISWKTHPIASEEPATFRLAVHSAISGRPLMVAVDQKGPGAGTAFVSEEPRMFYVVVDSKNLDWSFTVEERIN